MHNQKLKNAKVFYLCGGHLSCISDYLGITAKQLIDKSKRWPRLEKPKPPLPSHLYSNKGYRKLAQHLHDHECLTRSVISGLFNVDVAVVLKIARQDKWSRWTGTSVGLKKAQKLSTKDENNILALYKEGYTISHISDRYNFLSRGPVKRILLKYGVRVRPSESASIAYRRMIGTDSTGYMTPVNMDTVSRERFRSHVKVLTSFMLATYSKQINPKGLSFGTVNHLDHCYSIHQTFHNPAKLKNPINIWELCHPANLRVITAKENMTKHKKILFSAKELRRRIDVWNMTYWDPYFICADSKALETIRLTYGNYDAYGEKRSEASRSYYYISDGPQRQIHC